MKPDAGNAFMKIGSKLVIGFVVFLATTANCIAQGDIAVGSWRFHHSYNTILQLTGSDETVFAMGKNSLFYFSVDELMPKSFSKLDGLYGQDFASIAFDADSKTLLISYADGTLDVVSDRHVRRVNDIRTNSLITSKTINKLRIINGRAWLSADFGIAIVNLEAGFIESAFLNLGVGGESQPIFDVAIFADKVYAVTQSGVISAGLSANLNDFNQWERLDMENTNSFAQVVSVEDGLYLLGQDGQVYFWKSGSLEWIVGTFGVNNLKVSGENIFFSMDDALYTLDQHGNLEIISSQAENLINDFHFTPKGIFLASSDNGVSRLGENVGITIQGPPSSLLNFSQINDLIVGYSNAPPDLPEMPAQRQVGIFSFGNWTSWDLPANVKAVASIGEDLYIGTENGLFRKESEIFVPVIHPLLNGGVEISALYAGPAGQLYIGTNTPALHLLGGENIDVFSTYTIDGIQAIDKIQVDRLGNCWILDQQTGGGRLHQFIPETGTIRSFGSQVNNGALPGQSVRDIFLDSEQNLWIATNQGIAYFFNAPGIESSTAVNAVLPLFENRIALANMVTNQILIAPDRSVWIGTENQGLWQFSPDFEKLLQNFTVQNSPLPASRIVSLALNDRTGELFVSTAAGSLSYRTESLRPSVELGTLKIYPNPVRRDFNGVLSIEGLTDFSTLKIATTSGRVVASMAVAGGKVTWNLTDPSGNRIAAGIYLVYVINEEGMERTAGKFLIH